MSQLKLKNASGYSASLVPSSSMSSDKTFTLPTSASGTLLTTGNLGNVGKVLQVVQTTKIDRQSITATDTPMPVDIANFNVTITPSATTSKVLVHFTLHVGTEGYLFLNLLRGTTNIAQGTQDGSNRIACSVSVNQTQAYETTPWSFMYLDSPATQSSITYKVNGYLSQYANTTSAGPYTAFINRPRSYDDQDYSGNPMSTITAMEIGA